MARLLFIDTSASVATIALSVDGVLTALRTHEDAHEQAAVINYMIEAALEEASLTIKQMDAICVCAGPGSYTGLRVGLSTAKGLAYATDKPLMLFNRLDILAWQQQSDTDFIIALKARNGEYFMAPFDKQNQPAGMPQHAFEQDLAAYAAKGFHFFTDDETLAVNASITLIAANKPVDMAYWVKKAAERFRSGQFDDLAYAEPFYLKAAYTTVSKK